MCDPRFVERLQEEPSMNALAQVVMSIVALFILVSIATFVVRQESLAGSGLTPLRQQDELLLSHVTSSQVTFGTSAATHPSKADAIMDLQPSHNRVGGDQFSLSFLLKFKEDVATSRCLLLWGDPNMVKFNVADGESSIQHLLVFMPMIWLSALPSASSRGSPQHQITVYFNCMGSVRQSCTALLQKDPGSFDIVREGALITVTFRDYDINKASRGCMCNIYVNSQNVGVAKVPDESIRRNPGLMYVLPDKSLVPGISDSATHTDSNPSRLSINNLSYHNYELTPTDIMAKMRGSFKYTRDRPLDDKRKSATYDASNDLMYHLFVSSRHTL